LNLIRKKEASATIDNSDIMLSHPYSIDRSKIELKTFFLPDSLFSLLSRCEMQRKLDINHGKYDTLQFPMNYWLLIYVVGEKIVYNVTKSHKKVRFIEINAFANIICHVLVISRVCRATSSE
jgi:hypothetical protein